MPQISNIYGIVQLLQLPTGDNSHLLKNKTHLLPAKSTIPRTTPCEDNSPPLPTR